MSEDSAIPNKVVRDGKVAVLYSPGYGAGWYSWNSDEDLLFDPEIVAAVEAGDLAKAEAIAGRKYPDAYLGGAEQLRIEWIPQGTAFEIHEYDGSESIRYAERNWVIA
jgi:hypothetical protein